MTKSNDFESRTISGTIRLMVWTLAWVGTMVLVDKAVFYGWFTSTYISVLGIVVNAALGLGMIKAFLRYLRDMDEMHRKIQLDSLSLSMGAGFVGGFSYSLLATTGFVTDPEVSDIILLMGVTYMLALVIFHYRYR